MTGSVSATVRSRDGIPIVYDAVGSGDPALILVHGWSCDRTYWRQQTGVFADRHRVVTIDLAGHGESGEGRASWTMASFGEDVVAVVDDLGLANMVLVGHSMGGDVIVEAALRLGERVAGLVWVDTYDELTTPATEEQVQAFVEPFRGTSCRPPDPSWRGCSRPTPRPTSSWPSPRTCRLRRHTSPSTRSITPSRTTAR